MGIFGLSSAQSMSGCMPQSRLMGKTALNIETFNMVGFSNGASMLQDLCLNHQIIALQESWLSNEDSFKLTLICKDFNHRSVSPMTNRLEEGLLRGRPFGGIALMWNKSLDPFVQF